MNVRSLLLLASLLAFASVAWVPFAWAQTGNDPGVRQVDWPDTYAGLWAKEFFEAYNTDGEDALRRFVKGHYSEAYLQKTPLKEELGAYLEARKSLGKLAVYSVEAGGDFAVDVIARSKVLGWMKVQIELSPESPHDLTNMSPVPTSPPDAENPKDYRDWKDLRALLEKVRRDSGAPGMATAIVRDGKIVEKAVTGVRRSDRSDRVQIGDRFHIGSVAKAFTATMIGKLVENGVLRWDITIGEVLQDVPMRAEYRSVTLEQLLQMRGGVPTMPSTGEFAEAIDLWPRRSSADARIAFVSQVLTEEPVNPGEYTYSNAAFVVAGHMAERVTKRSWEELMRSLLFEPLGLRSAGFGWPATRDHPNQPHGHLGTAPDLSVEQAGEWSFGEINYAGPAGNIHCSIVDLARFAAFHLQGLQGRDDVLKAETIRRLHTPPKEGYPYAGGWGIDEIEVGEHLHGHLGSGGTFLAMVALYPESDLVIVAAANCGQSATPYLKKMRDAIYQRVTGASSAPRANGEGQ